MICLSDNDILLKLCACRLMEETIAALGSTKQEIYVLPTARYKIRRDRGGKLQAKYGAQGVAATLAFIASVREIAQEPLRDEHYLLSQIEDIDDGEQLLFAATASYDPVLLATGDKRSLRALHTAPSCVTICDRLAGRVLCLEQIVSRLISHLGFEEVRSRVVPARECDTSLKGAFGSGLMAQHGNVAQYLENRVAELRAETGVLLWEEPPHFLDSPRPGALL